MSKHLNRVIGATMTSALAGTMLMAAPAAQAAPGDSYGGKRQATVIIRVPAGVEINSRSAVRVRLASDAGSPNGLVSVTLRRNNGKIIQRKFCRTKNRSTCRVRFDTPRRGRGGVITARFFGNKLYDAESAARNFRYSR